jgi:hypothetical protein
MFSDERRFVSSLGRRHEGKRKAFIEFWVGTKFTNFQ